MTTAAGAPAQRATRAVQALAALTLLNLLYQFVTAGQLFPHGGPERAHALGAVGLHVLSGLTALAVYLRYRVLKGQVWPVVLAAVVFVATFVQAATGGRDSLAVHVPGALVLTVGAVWLTAWAVLVASRPD